MYSWESQTLYFLLCSLNIIGTSPFKDYKQKKVFAHIFAASFLITALWATIALSINHDNISLILDRLNERKYVLKSELFVIYLMINSDPTIGVRKWQQLFKKSLLS